MSCLAAALILIPSLTGQSKDADRIRKAVARASKAAGKSDKGSAWLSLAEAYEDAYLFPLSNLVPGEGNSVRTLVVKGQRPREIMAPTLVEGIYRNVYSDKDIYFSADGELVAIRVTRPVLDTVDALSQALNAYSKAYERDKKGAHTAQIADRISHIATEFRTLAEMSSRLKEEEASVRYYRKAASASTTPPCTQPDIVALQIVAAEDRKLQLEQQERERILRLKASAMDIYEKGAQLYHEAMELVDQAAALPAGEDKAFQQIQREFTTKLRSAAVPLRQSFTLTEDPSVREKAGALLQEICLFFGVESLDDLGD